MSGMISESSSFTTSRSDSDAVSSLLSAVTHNCSAGPSPCSLLPSSMASTLSSLRACALKETLPHGLTLETAVCVLHNLCLPPPSSRCRPMDALKAYAIDGLELHEIADLQGVGRFALARSLVSYLVPGASKQTIKSCLKDPLFYLPELMCKERLRCAVEQWGAAANSNSTNDNSTNDNACVASNDNINAANDVGPLHCVCDTFEVEEDDCNDDNDDNDDNDERKVVGPHCRPPPPARPPAFHDAASLPRSLLRLIISDPLCGPHHDVYRRCIGQEYELKLHRSLDVANVPYYTEADLRAKGASKTPDVVLLSPISFRSKHGTFPVSWIDSKANFGDVSTHKNTVLPQLKSYLNRYGPGLVVYYFGHAPLDLLWEGVEEDLREQIFVSEYGMPEITSILDA